MIEEDISALIRDLLAATASGDSEGILNATLSLDSLNKERGTEIKGHLKHYLDKRSYQKALAFIEE
jgi:hypothetical protein